MGWGRAAAATYLVGFVILVICFALAVIAFSIEILRFNFVRGIGGLLFVVAAFQIIGLVIYPVKFTEDIPLLGDNMFSWAYGFGWASTVVVIDDAGVSQEGLSTDIGEGEQAFAFRGLLDNPDGPLTATGILDCLCHRTAAGRMFQLARMRDNTATSLLIYQQANKPRQALTGPRQCLYSQIHARGVFVRLRQSRTQVFFSQRSQVPARPFGDLCRGSHRFVSPSPWHRGPSPAKHLPRAMVKYGLDYTRCRWILPLLLGIGVIFGIIALAGRGWLESQTLPYVQQASLWQDCRRPEQGGEWSCESLMRYGKRPRGWRAAARDRGSQPPGHLPQPMEELKKGEMGLAPKHYRMLLPAPSGLGVSPICFHIVTAFGTQLQEKHLAWGRAAAATYLVGFLLLVICFALAIIAFAIDTLRFNFIRGIGGLLFVAAVFSIMGLVIYPVKFSSEMEMTGINMFSWAYGFGWTTAIMEIGLGFFFCCLPNYEDQILELTLKRREKQELRFKRKTQSSTKTVSKNLLSVLTAKWLGVISSQIAFAAPSFILEHNYSQLAMKQPDLKHTSPWLCEQAGAEPCSSLWQCMLKEHQDLLMMYLKPKGKMDNEKSRVTVTGQDMRDEQKSTSNNPVSAGTVLESSTATYLLQTEVEAYPSVISSSGAAPPGRQNNNPCGVSSASAVIPLPVYGTAVITPAALEIVAWQMLVCSGSCSKVPDPQAKIKAQFLNSGLKWLTVNHLMDWPSPIIMCHLIREGKIQFSKLADAERAVCLCVRSESANRSLVKPAPPKLGWFQTENTCQSARPALLHAQKAEIMYSSPTPKLLCTEAITHDYILGTTDCSKYYFQLLWK
ncbi:hypothetical protein IHE44_0009298 [Lamprotornis superbus]|uniref:Uncharacterized protein n=1 Tax=Lamprotornis superbus TaxID=245042 RepID=A0A835P2B5_9PASS|nr:hypothetical protein IHE44_0009298 [Lamprotornis superbus]